MTTRADISVELQQERAHACRLTPDRALQTLEEAVAFLAERGMLTLTPSGSLPSLFGACHEEPYRAGGHGFASWPRTKWWWAGALATQPGVYALSILQGKRLFLSEATAALVDPLCRWELGRAERGEYGSGARELVGYLAAAGRSRLDEITADLGIEGAALKTARARLERVGAIVSCPVSVPAASGGERETSELARWDQVSPVAPLGQSSAHGPNISDLASASDTTSALDALLTAGVRAAVAAPKHEVMHWFFWRVSEDQIDHLIATGRLQESYPGWVTTSNADD